MFMLRFFSDLFTVSSNALMGRPDARRARRQAGAVEWLKDQRLKEVRQRYRLFGQLSTEQRLLEVRKGQFWAGLCADTTLAEQRSRVANAKRMLRAQVYHLRVAHLAYEFAHGHPRRRSEPRRRVDRVLERSLCEGVMEKLEQSKFIYDVIELGEWLRN